MWIDVGKLIREQVPDKNGKLLPQDLTSGSYQLRDLSDKFIGSLYEGKIVYDKTFGHVTYGCAGCCAYSQSQLRFSPLGIPLLSTSANGVDAYDTCSSWWESVDESFYGNWSTASTAIATVDYYATHTGKAVGSTTSSTSGYLLHPNPRTCSNVLRSPQGSDNVTLNISQDRPLWFFGAGNTPPAGFNLGGIAATLTASGGGNGTYVWTITSGTSKLTLENNSSTITKTNTNTVGITSTSYSTQANDVTVQLQFTPSGGSQLPAQTYSLSIDSPYKLVLNGSVATTGAKAGASACAIPNPNPNGTDGYQTLVPYSMKSFFGVQITFENANESFSGQTNIYQTNNWPAYSVTPGFTSTGNFFDNICTVATGGLTPPPEPPQGGNVGIDYASQAWFVGTQVEGAGVKVWTDTLTRYQDHGTVTNITSPVR